MKRVFASAVFVGSILCFVQPIVNAEPVNSSANIQGSGCPYVCKQELKRCRKGKKACRKQYTSCIRECPH